MSKSIIYEVTNGGETLEVEVVAIDETRFRVRLGDGPEHEVDARQIDPQTWHLIEDGVAAPLNLRQLEPGKVAVLDGVRESELTVINQQRKAMSAQAGAGAAQGDINAQMPGKIVSVLVEPGQQVTAGDGLLIIEAMKMENEVKAPGEGTIAEVFVSAGDAVDSGERLLRIE